MRAGRKGKGMRVLIHPGFHKTGTTSLQRGAQAQAKVLDGRVRLILPHDLEPVNFAARRYSVGPNVKRKAAFQDAVAEFAGTLDPEDRRPLLISSEHLCGLIPGRKTVRDYGAAPDLVEVFAGAVARHLPGAELTVWFSTRGPRAWLRSVYWQNLRSMRITEDLQDFSNRLETAADLDRIVAAVRARLGGRMAVLSTALEDFGARPLGPLGVALKLLGVSDAGLAPLPQQNVQPTEAADLLLALNRSDLDEDDLARAKTDALTLLRESGQTRRA